MTSLILSLLYTVLTFNFFDSDLQALKDRFNASSHELDELLTCLSTNGQSEFDVPLLSMVLIQEPNQDLAKGRLGLNYKLKLFVGILSQLGGVLSKLKPPAAGHF